MSREAIVQNVRISREAYETKKSNHIQIDVTEERAHDLPTIEKERIQVNG